MNAREALQMLMGQVPPFGPGWVWLAGAGPGDPGHLTLHTLAGLAQADAVVHDALVSEGVLALARPDAERVFAGKRGGRPSSDQADITARLIALAQAGRRVLRLKGGDPCVFGRGGEEALALARAGVPFRIIPGLTSGLAGLAAASIPATMRGVNQALLLVTGHAAEAENALDWRLVAQLGQPIVFYMALRTIGRIARALTAHGFSPATPAAVIAAATTPQERITVCSLDQLEAAAASFDPALPAITVIGGIVAVRDELMALQERIRCLLPA